MNAASWTYAWIALMKNDKIFPAMRTAEKRKRSCFLKRIIHLILAVFLVIPCLQGCAQRRNKIAYTIYPVGYLIQRISGDTMQYASIQKSDTVVQRAKIADDYQSILKQSYVLFHIGDLEPYLSVHHTEISATGVQDMDLSADNAVYDFGRYVKKNTESGSIESVEPYYSGEQFDDVDVNAKDLCLWIDPIAMMSMGKDIRDWLIRNNPNEESLYTENFRKLEDDLINLDAQYQNLSAELSENNQRIAFVSMTPSFGNWQKGYGFSVYPVVLSKYGVLPDEEQLRIIEERIRKDHVHYIVKEPNLPEDMAELEERVKNDCTLQEVSLSNLSSLSDSENKQGKDYLSIMYENLNTLKDMAEDNPSSSSN